MSDESITICPCARMHIPTMFRTLSFHGRPQFYERRYYSWGTRPRIKSVTRPLPSKKKDPCVLQLLVYRIYFCSHHCSWDSWLQGSLLSLLFVFFLGSYVLAFCARNTFTTRSDLVRVNFVEIRIFVWKRKKLQAFLNSEFIHLTVVFCLLSSFYWQEQ